MSKYIFKNFKMNKFDLNYLYKKEIPSFSSVTNYKYQNLTLLTNLNP